jgi:hypothetical protein
VFSVQNTLAQKKSNPDITQVEFEESKIILNKKHAFNYYKEGNDFIISDLNDNQVIMGTVTPIGNKKFTSKFYFVTIGKEFHNKEIIGRNDLIMALCQYNVINKKLEIDNKKLEAFVEANNDMASYSVKGN